MIGSTVPIGTGEDLAIRLGLLGAGIALALLCLWLSLRALRKRRLIRDIPTSKVQGVFIGLVELKGKAKSPDPLTSHLAGEACVHYTWSVEEHWSRWVTETYTDSKGNTRTRTRRESGWTTVDHGGAQVPFFLEDDTGRLLVRPGGAKIEPVTIFSRTVGTADPLYYDKGPAHAVMDSDHRRRFTEEALPVGIPLYIVGRARERKDVVAPEIAEDKEAPLYLISTRSEKQVGAGFLWKAWLLGILGFVLVTAGGVAMELMGAKGMRGAYVPGVAAGSAAGGFVLAWLLCWVWMAFNSVLNLRERVNQGWSLVDVELKRRADLIPRLVAVVEGLRSHEAKVQQGVADMRSQAYATAPGEEGPDPRGCAGTLLAIAEAYPELKSQEAFLSLQEQLSETEQRIALARAYYNDIATFFNTRLEMIPDRWVAKLASLEPKRLIAASGFERAPVPVDLAS